MEFGIKRGIDALDENMVLSLVRPPHVDYCV